MNKKVIITVSGGVAYVQEPLPAGVDVEIRDYDIDGVDADNLATDEGGAHYCGGVHKGETE